MKNKCPCCNIKFIKYRSNQIYCSKKCRKKEEKRRSTKRKRTVKYKECLSCGKQFKTHTTPKNNKRYCAKKCRIKHQDIKYLEKRKVRLKAQRKIKILKNQLCEHCKKEKATDRHHEDYSKPLEIIFLCKKCHTKLHKKLKS